MASLELIGTFQKDFPKVTLLGEAETVTQPWFAALGARDAASGSCPLARRLCIPGCTDPACFRALECAWVLACRCPQDLRLRPFMPLGDVRPIRGPGVSLPVPGLPPSPEAPRLLWLLESWHLLLSCFQCSPSLSPSPSRTKEEMQICLNLEHQWNFSKKSLETTHFS